MTSLIEKLRYFLHSHSTESTEVKKQKLLAHDNTEKYTIQTHNRNILENIAKYITTSGFAPNLKGLWPKR